MDTTLPEPTDQQATGAPGATGSTERESRAGETLSGATTPATTVPAATTPAATGAGAPGRWPVRVGTVVWGLVVMVVGVGLLALAAGAVFDVELAVIALVAAAGVALLAGSLVSAGRRRR
ncbi:hypothetical protein [Actinotalea sp.]|uniref:hypothetical protein n=1 Tax=Actinotalea sp. TaxID=1872145 RepID=UPI00356AD040